MADQDMRPASAPLAPKILRMACHSHSTVCGLLGGVRKEVRVKGGLQREGGAQGVR